MKKKTLKIILGFFLAILLAQSFSFSGLSASRIDDLKTDIAEKNKEIGEIQKEIDLYQEELAKISDQKTTLKTEINRLELNRKKLNSDIYLTKKQIEAANLNIEQLALEIELRNGDIGARRGTLAETIRHTYEMEARSLVEIVLANQRLSDFFGDLERMDNLRKSIGINLDELKQLKTSLQIEKEQEAAEKNKLENLQSQLVDQKVLVDSAETTKNKLLAETKNKEANYQKILENMRAKQQALQEEISQIEEQMRVEIDPQSIPQPGTKSLNWPIDNPYVTQGFGLTSFAMRNPGIYGSQGHNGIDLRAPIGTPIKASKDGVVRGVGDTDAGCRGASYGKWILVDHSNNLSTIYAHLSIVKVNPGQNVMAGQIIAYSGQTGYCFGPHLHFTVAASKAVEIQTIKTKTCGTNITLPLAPTNWYLNPMSYL